MKWLVQGVANTKWRVADLFILPVGILSLVFILQWVFQDTRDPVSIANIEIANSPVFAGGKMEMIITRKVVRDCPGVWQVQLINQHGVRTLLGIFPNSGDEPTEEYEDLPVLIPIPENIPAETYDVRAIGDYDCNGEQFIIRQPDATVRIVVGVTNNVQIR